jgi:two-component sensor histidine kinase
LPRLDSEGRLRIAYEDDGVGFPEDFDVTEAGHIGMNFIRPLSTGLGGHHEWHSDSLGIRFEIVLPISARPVKPLERVAELR